jgi:DNA-binding NarL/FixJ family response regulator
MDQITIIVVDDHPIFRQGIADALSLEPDMVVIAQADSGERGLQLIRAQRPDVAILDINLPGINGQQVVHQVASEKLPTRMVLLTAYDDLGQKVQGLLAGASAYCTKDVQPELLSQIVRGVASGKFWVGQKQYEAAEIRKWLDEQTCGGAVPYAEPGRLSEPLSAREMEILVHITRGLSNKEIRLALGISHQTVKNHVTSILHKLRVNDRTQAALCALQYGWVRLTE